MARRTKYFTPALSPAQQMFAMATAYPGRFRVGFDRDHAITWTGTVLPTALATTYEVRIVYMFPRRPVVWVTNPPIGHVENGSIVPHTFSNGSICLHLHEEWVPQMQIASTVVPWLSLWLEHYEVWQTLGEWLGGGHSRGPRSE